MSLPLLLLPQTDLLLEFTNSTRVGGFGRGMIGSCNEPFLARLGINPIRTTEFIGSIKIYWAGDFQQHALENGVDVVRTNVFAMLEGAVPALVAVTPEKNSHS